MFQKIINFIEKNIGAVITFVIITFMLVAFGFGSNWWNDTISNMNSSRNKANNIKYSSYDKTTVTGMEVLNCIKYNADTKCVITVTTVDSNTGITVAAVGYIAATGTGGYDSSLPPSDPRYIEPTGVFTSIVNTNKKGTVIGITFAQKSS